MNRTTLIIIILLLSIPLIAQLESRVILEYSNVEVKNSIGENLLLLTFDDCYSQNGMGSLPFSKSNFELPDECFELDIDIVEIKADTILANDFANIADNDLVKNDFEIVIDYIGKEVSIYVLPLKRDVQSGNIIALTEFIIQADLVLASIERTGNHYKQVYANQSVLRQGTWIKMGIVKGGIHKLGYPDLVDMGLNPSEIFVDKIGVFGNYNGMLPENTSYSRPDDLQENSIYISGVDDGSFDEDDYILFYAQDPTIWKYNVFTKSYFHYTNIYSDTVFYFFTPDQGTAKKLLEVDGSSLSPTHFCSDFMDYFLHEKDLVNFLSSGQKWYGEKFSGDTMSREFDFNIPNINVAKSAYFNLSIVARSLTDSYYKISINDNLLIDSTKIRATATNQGIYGRESTSSFSYYLESENLKLKIDYLSDAENASAWLDYIEFNCFRNLVFSGNQMKFSNPLFASPGSITQFGISNSTPNDIIWEITDAFNPKIIKTDYINGVNTYNIPTDSILTFVVHDGSNYYTPVSYKTVPNQNLHAVSNVNLVIVRPDSLSAQANRLAELHEINDGLKSVSVSPEQLFNEFSSGSQDVTALRNFMKMLYDNGAFNNQRAYLMLFGNASFDYKDRVKNNTNIVPTYQAAESLRETASFVTDDYFGLLDDNEGSQAKGDLNIGIGRFPVVNIEEAKATVDKVFHYVENSTDVMRNWRCNICFVADDQDNNLHFDQAEGLVSIVDTLNQGITIGKIYSDAYKIVTVPGGNRFPDVNTKISETVSNGTLILNYTGHGGVLGWSEEIIIDVPMINSFENIDNLPLVITASCEFSRFDNPEMISAGEYFFLNENGGAIALLTTTRKAYAHSNYIVNKRIYANLLSCDNGEVPRLGDLVRLSKIPSNDNYLNFVLLGDPALTLAYPKYEIVTTIDSTTNVSDTVHALTLVSVSGNIVDKDGKVVEYFNGLLYPKVLDKASTYSTLGNESGSYPAEFLIFDKSLFEGKISVTNGKFSFDFMIPKDIAYKYGYGKIAYYALDTINYVDAWGAYKELLIGGINNDAIIDDKGPDINIYLNNNSFVSGDVVTSSPVLLATIFDESGVNCTGSSIGRDIVMIIDENYSNPFILNNYFSFDIDSYQSGKIIYPLSNLSNGHHTLTIKAWDIQNNSTEKTIEFVVDDNAVFSLFEVINKPNPFDDETVFSFSHNKGGITFNVSIRIYDLQGNFIVELSTGEEYLNKGSISWNGKNANEVPISSGMYVYTIEVTDNYGNIAVQQQKLFRISR